MRPLGSAKRPFVRLGHRRCFPERRGVQDIARESLPRSPYLREGLVHPDRRRIPGGQDKKKLENTAGDDLSGEQDFEESVAKGRHQGLRIRRRDREKRAAGHRLCDSTGVIRKSAGAVKGGRPAAQSNLSMNRDVNDAIGPTGLDHLAVQTRWSENATNNSLVDSKPSVAIRGTCSRFIWLATS
jgi:hypothetical protein